MVRVERPWGYEIVWEVPPDTVGKVLHITRGHRLWLAAPKTAASVRVITLLQGDRREARTM